MPARRPATPPPADQLVAHETSNDAGKQRMIAELARTHAAVDSRLGSVETTLKQAPAVTGSRASGAALTSLLAALAGLGLITDKTTV